ncbi:pleckstrin homology domain-containing family M member 2-like isoform X2 [Tachypleus tridentatus]|uniref:pleckstrin homology domain-containing family M member 2-like isoform X2 n=1 Tax=Tachypleus tridentatus TaxID=6853 RepID=UPI003FD04E04
MSTVMVSPIGSVPVIETVATLEASDESKDRILRSIQLAVREIHDLASKANPDFMLNGQLQEVHFLCERLDKLFLHGLKQLQWGYWSFVQEFCHQDTREYLKTLELVTTSLGRGRAWLFHALNESTLEGYIRSFLQNPKIVRKYYMQPALLRDEQRTQLLITIVAGLEFVPFQLQLDMLSLDTPEFFSSKRKVKKRDSASSWSLDMDSEGTMPSSSSLGSFQEFDSGVVCPENAVEVTCENDVAEVIEVEVHAEMDDNATPKATPPEERARIQHIIDMDLLNCDAASSDTTDVEIIRTKVVRRRKKVISKIGYNGNDLIPTVEKQNILAEHKPGEEQNGISCNRYSRDSGMCCETPSNLELDDDFEQTKNISNSLKVLEIPSHFDNELLTPSEPCNMEGLVTKIRRQEDSTQVWMEERGVPEGEETPRTNEQHQESLCSLSLQLDSPKLEDTETSIYDFNNVFVNKIGYFKKSSPAFQPCEEDSFETVEIETAKNSPIEERKDTDCTEMFQNQLLNMKDIGSQSDLRLDSNTLLFLMLEVFENDDEMIYKMFLTTTEFVEGFGRHIFLLLTNKCLYVLQPGIGVYKFHKLLSFTYSEIDCVLLFLNYQGFLLISGDRKKKFPVWTGCEYMTRSIMSSLELAIRRTKPPVLPCVPTSYTGQITVLKKTLAAENKTETSEFEVHHYVLVFWDNHKNSPSPSSTPGGPKRSGFLMYRTKKGRDGSSNPWKPAYFLLKAGVLYCFEHEEVKEPKFFIHLRVPHCGGCRRLPLEDRPHSFEIILPDWDSLQMAASNDIETSDWLQDLIYTVSQADRILEIDPPLPTQCCLVFAGDFMFTVLINNCGGEIKTVLGRASITDLVTLSCDEETPNCCILEFDCTEADSCSGEWVFYFVSEHEQKKFVCVLSSLWEDLFKIPLAKTAIKDLKLKKRCQERWAYICQTKEVLHKLCLDS